MQRSTRSERLAEIKVDKGGGVVIMNYVMR